MRESLAIMGGMILSLCIGFLIGVIIFKQK